MKVTLTLGEIMDKGRWDEFCELKGWNVYCVNEGQASSDDEVTLTYEELVQLGLTNLGNVSRIDM